MFTTVSTAKRESKSGPHNLQYYKDQNRKVKMLLKKYQKGGYCIGMSISVKGTFKTTPLNTFKEYNTFSHLP